MSHFNSRIATLALATALTVGPAVAFAQNDVSTGADANMKSIADVVQMLESQDYTQIDEIDRDMDRYDVEATDPAGQRVELTIDANSGEILRSERDDD
ncbi:Peptidase propeptide [Salinisphaera shabanensis E1L3A]|uniref:Peptidase propeptide n=1 Tax=Salinisphaera shabanensis E1L3A TaxID=1033802 RepID=U2EB04_9GAMM|nr:PepSY domain-containing protein [Salinisphaera shabanensis]ERJ20831.1 Peptidase propeptide [Salinisphaera shabanensis E1L3A]